MNQKEMVGGGKQQYSKAKNLLTRTTQNNPTATPTQSQVSWLPLLALYITPITYGEILQEY